MTELDVEELIRERDEFKDKYLRALAEMDNYRKMLEKEKSMEIERCKAEILREFLPLYESLEKAAGDEGLNPIFRQMQSIFEGLGVREINPVGEEFDPAFHEAIAVVEGKDDNRIVEVYQKGFMMGDKVLRHAKVLVSKKEVKEK